MKGRIRMGRYLYAKLQYISIEPFRSYILLDGVGGGWWWWMVMVDGGGGRWWWMVAVAVDGDGGCGGSHMRPKSHIRPVGALLVLSFVVL